MLLPAITWQNIFYKCIDQLHIMPFASAAYTLGATVAYLHCVLIKNIEELVGECK